MAGTIVIDTVQSSTANPPVFQNTSGTQIGQLCRAWINYRGTTSTIMGSLNVSSVTVNSSGNFTINFTNAFADTNYAIAGFARNDLASPNGLYSLTASSTSTKTTTACQVQSAYWNGGYGTANTTEIGVVFFR